MADVLNAAPPERLETHGVVLRAMTAADWTLEQALSRDPEIIRWTTHPPDLDEATARQRMADVADRAGRWLGQRYAVCPLEGEAVGEPVGMAALTVERSPEPSVGYALLPAGRGARAGCGVGAADDRLAAVGGPPARPAGDAAGQRGQRRRRRPGRLPRPRDRVRTATGRVGVPGALVGALRLTAPSDRRA
ncbi:hypothetical protein A7K94_0202975 [Modestobacter sp. VKM Ac-2676]|nr:hypothetical protein A7K94_0202975 [Modestobacter sp. VKM Ac-2676]